MKKYKKVMGYKECPSKTGIYPMKWRDGTGLVARLPGGQVVRCLSLIDGQPSWHFRKVSWEVLAWLEENSNKIWGMPGRLGDNVEKIIKIAEDAVNEPQEATR